MEFLVIILLLVLLSGNQTRSRGGYSPAKCPQGNPPLTPPKGGTCARRIR